MLLLPFDTGNLLFLLRILTVRRTGGFVCLCVSFFIWYCVKMSAKCVRIIRNNFKTFRSFIGGAAIFFFHKRVTNDWLPVTSFIFLSNPRKPMRYFPVTRTNKDKLTMIKHRNPIFCRSHLLTVSSADCWNGPKLNFGCYTHSQYATWMNMRQPYTAKKEKIGVANVKRIRTVSVSSDFYCDETESFGIIFRVDFGVIKCMATATTAEWPDPLD